MLAVTFGADQERSHHMRCAIALPGSIGTLGNRDTADTSCH